ncbi:MAG: endonuclease/exonuclease/phosphatase family protein [Desulfobacteraceae bacterium]
MKVQMHRDGDFTLKVMTYNIKSCMNRGRKVDPESTVESVSCLMPDVIALQEVDVGKKRTGFMDQAEYLAGRLNMNHYFFPVMESEEEKYGLALLSVYPVAHLECCFLPALGSGKPKERRGFMAARIETPAGSLNVVNTHLGLNPGDRKVQAESLFRDEALRNTFTENEALILCGDFNCGPRSPVYRKIVTHLKDVQTAAAQRGYPRSTFFSWYPFLRLDHIFVSEHFNPVHVHVPGTGRAKSASDHLPVFAKLALNNSIRLKKRAG